MVFKFNFGYINSICRCIVDLKVQGIMEISSVLSVLCKFLISPSLCLEKNMKSWFDKERMLPSGESALKASSTLNPKATYIRLTLNCFRGVEDVPWVVNIFLKKKNECQILNYVVLDLDLMLIVPMFHCAIVIKPLLLIISFSFCGLLEDLYPSLI